MSLPSSSNGKVFSLVRRLEEAVLVGVLAGMIVLAVTQILLRNVLGGGLVWADPLLRLAVLWLGMAGAALASREDRHIAIDTLPRLLPPRARAGVRVVTDLFTAAVAAVLARHATRLVLADRTAGAAAFSGMPAWVAEAVLPVAFGVVAWRYLAMAWRHARELARRPG
ncbi:MAG: TRAP transporter small permease [Thermoanaerobaculaceae bacterium]|jgi:TRAP-type C4-dicarboxylate transport system permease small subunit|nr:TRAP transporter small permease [Thermoanaerobaculaceae bacterium]